MPFNPDLLNEPCDNLTDWTVDTGGTLGTCTAVAGKYEFRAPNSPAINYANADQTVVGGFPSLYSVKIALTITALVGNGPTTDGWIAMAWDNGIVNCSLIITTDGIYLYNGASYILISATNFNDSAEHIFSFLISGAAVATATMDIWDGKNKIVSNADNSFATASGDGYIRVQVRANANKGPINFDTNYIQVGSGLQPPEIGAPIGSLAMLGAGR